MAPHATGTMRATRSVAPAGRDRFERHRQHWRDEMNSAALFAGLAATSRSARRRQAYERLAEVERGHAERFAIELARAGVTVPAFRPSWRTRLLLALARRFGTPLVLPRIAQLERADARSYEAADEAWWPTDEEHANAVWLSEFATHEATEALKRLVLRTRRIVILVLGATLFGVSLALARNVQLEGLFFGLLTGVTVGPVTHYLLGKVLAPLGLGRVWCGWACWTAAVLDQLPYRRSPGWLGPRWRRGRYVHFVLSLAVVLVLVAGFGYAGGAVGASAAGWFLVGNVVYWALGVALAVRLRDNRAFCKYACPVAVVLRQTARLALVKVSGDAASCAACDSRACVTQCPMGIAIPDYVAAGMRVLSSECITCQHCVAVCPPNTLGLSFGLDVGGHELLLDRPAA
jgi:ferredoxin-type protein NapH